MIRNNKGFTLIELLVVIAIIGILSSVVLASLNTAREKSQDTAIKANIANARAQAELFYDEGNTYEGVCADATNGIDTIYAGVEDLSDTSECADATGGWAIEADLPSAGWIYCLDSTGVTATSGSSMIEDDTDISCN